MRSIVAVTQFPLKNTDQIRHGHARTSRLTRSPSELTHFVSCRVSRLSHLSKHATVFWIVHAAPPLATSPTTPASTTPAAAASIAPTLPATTSVSWLVLLLFLYKFDNFFRDSEVFDLEGGD